MHLKRQPLHHSSAPFRACGATAAQVLFKMKQWENWGAFQSRFFFFFFFTSRVLFARLQSEAYRGAKGKMNGCPFVRH